MKVSTWIPKHSTLPRTLADVPDGEQRICYAGVTSGRLMVMHRKGSKAFYSHSGGHDGDDSLLPPHEFQLHLQPSSPTKLEDVPDRRIVRAAAFSLGGVNMMHDALWFRCGGTWYMQTSEDIGFNDDHLLMPGGDWQLTDHVAELVETEIGVMT